jgi:hypothetical protein
MKPLNIGEILFVHTLRKRGFTLFAVVCALVLLSLSATTAFGLGRELVMVREAGFGTLFVAGFLASLLASHSASGEKGRRWAQEALSRPVGRSALALGFLCHTALAGLWTALFLTPFLVASLALFHGRILHGVVCILLGGSILLLGYGLGRQGVPEPWSRLLAAMMGALAGAPFLLGLPEGGHLLTVLIFSFVPILLVSLLPGAFTGILPGASGLIASLSLFFLANMREAISGSGVPGRVASLLPDLSNLNPSLVSSHPSPLCFREFAGMTAYAALGVLGLALISVGVVSIRHEMS